MSITLSEKHGVNPANAKWRASILTNPNLDAYSRAEMLHIFDELESLHAAVEELRKRGLENQPHEIGINPEYPVFD
jgi:hypothetical protein